MPPNIQDPMFVQGLVDQYLQASQNQQQPAPAQAPAQAPAPKAGLDARLNPGMQEAGLLERRMAQLEDVEGQEGPSTLGTIFSGKGLLAGGLTAAGLLSGNSGLAGLGAGMGAGFLSGAVDAPHDFNTMQMERIEQLAGMVEKSQQRVMSLLQSDPGLFVNADMENYIDPVKWAELTGTGIPMNPAAMLARAQATADRKAALETASELIDLGQKESNPAVAYQGLAILNAEHGWGFSPDTLRNYALMDPREFAGVLMDELNSAAVAHGIKVAGETGKALHHPDIMEYMITYNESGTVAQWMKPGSPSEAITIEGIQGMKWFNDVWMNGTSTIGEGENAREVSNRTLYSRNPIEAFEMAFAENPAGRQAILNTYPNMAIGDKIQMKRLDALVDALALMPYMQGALAGAFDPAATPEQQRNAIAKVAGSLESMSNGAIGMHNLGESLNESSMVGNRYAARAGVPARRSEDLGGLLVSRAALLARGVGVDYNTLDQQQRDYFLEQAFQDYFGGEGEGEDIDTGVTAEPGDVEVTGEPGDTEAPQAPGPRSARTAVTPPKLKTIEATAPAPSAANVPLATNEGGMLNDVLESVKNLPAAVDKQLTDEHRARLQSFEDWASMNEKDRRLLLSDPEYSRAIATAKNVAEMSFTEKEVEDLVDKAAEYQPIVIRFRQFSPERQEMLARDPEYKAALEWERRYHLAGPERVGQVHRRRLRQADAAARAMKR